MNRLWAIALVAAAFQLYLTAYPSKVAHACPLVCDPYEANACCPTWTCTEQGVCQANPEF